MNTTATTRELAFRENDGLEVSLLWHADDDCLTVRVDDTRSGISFEVATGRDNALDVYYHPYAYATLPEDELLVAA